MFLEFLYLALGISALIYGGKWLVSGASMVARWLNISPLIIGLVVVSIGTSAPELVVNIKSALLGSTGLALGNIVGSNIANILLILGIGALIKPIVLDPEMVRKDIPYMLLATIVITVFVSDTFIDGSMQNILTRVESMALLCFFAIFLAYIYFNSVSKQKDEIIEEVPRNTFLKSMALIPLGTVALALGGEFTVESAINVAQIMGVSERVIGLTIVAVGTSLPELVTSIIAIQKGKIEIMLGNLIGSNIFNIFFILGITGVIRPLVLENIPHIDFGFMLGSVALLITSLTIGKKHTIEKSQALLMLLSYFVYLFLVIFL